MHNVPGYQSQVLSLALKASNSGIWDWDMSGDTVTFDPNYYRMAGYEPNEFPHKFEEWGKRVHPQDLPSAQKAFQQYLVGNTENYSAEFRFKTKAGDWMWILTKGEITARDENGTPTRFTGLHIDISQIKNAENKFQEERAFNTNLIDTAQLIILVLDTDGRIRRINPYMEAITGYKEAEVKGKDWFDTFLPPADNTMIRAMFKKAIADIDVSGEANPIVAKDGRELMIEWHSKTLKDANDTIIGLLSFGIDITERKSTEDSLKKNQKLLKEVESIGKVGGWEIYIDSGEYLCTDEVYHIHEISTDSPLGVEHGIEYYTPESRPIIVAAVQQAIEQEKPFEVELQIVTGKGHLRDVLSIGKPDLENRRIYGFFQDITAHKKAEAERLKLETELRQKHKMEAVGYMAGGMAHNFNNNLSIILGNVELSQMKQAPGSESIQLLENAKIAVRRSRDLVQKIITYSRKGMLNKVPTKLTVIIDETITLLQATLPTTINLQKKYCSDCHTKLINADPSQIQEVLIDLCNNAVQAMDEKGDLTISLEPVELQAQDISAHYDCLPGHYAKFSVQDNGCGMPAEMLDKIFDPFYSTKEEYEGAGMGLSTVQGIVAQHGGMIKVNSQLNHGTTFELYFPLLDLTDNAESETEKPPLSKGTECILFVDDDERLAILGERLLSTLGYQVSMMTDSTEALKMFTANADRFDLVITDQTMPQLTGKELIAEIKKVRSDIPTILCTGYSSKIDEAKAVELGISAFMMKPLDLPILSQTIRQVLDGKDNS